ncbi:MAG TPA: glycerol-3-phosphate dehydrogenase C-terminal domain-containing protein, partial [Trueperaceae bacterium]|nr:glycerol-3-phosphate dehydrogenase C-terminal domain-containing protein [Trueperaceae bacterium]
AERFGLDADVAAHLARTYGGEAPEVAALGKELGLLERLHPDHPYLEVEVLEARQKEYAVSADDVLERRLRLAFLERDAAESVRGRVEELLVDV